MFHSETLARVIHADRVRDLERAAEAHRLLAATDDEVAPVPPALAQPAPIPASVTVSGPASASCRPAARDGSTGVAA